MKRPRHLRLAELRARLARVRETTSWLTTRAGLGCELRQVLAEQGSPTWRPWEELSWRTRVDREGDEEARALLAAIDELLEEMAAKAKAGEEEANTGS